MFTIAQTRHLCVLCTESIEKDEIYYETGAIVKYKYHDHCYPATPEGTPATHASGFSAGKTHRSRYSTIDRCRSTRGLRTSTSRFCVNP